jgi:hypothetical protein
MNSSVQHLKTITLGPLSPSNLAHLEIQRLCGDEETMRIVVLGGALTEDQVAENSRRKQLRKQKIIDIIKKHGVEAEYIAPRVANIRRLKAELKEEQSWLAALKS